MVEQREFGMAALRIALFTYSTKARGGVVHTLSLAKALQEIGHSVHIFALSSGEGFFRSVNVPHTLVGCPVDEAETIEHRVSRRIGAYCSYLSRLTERFDIYHAQDCISANALLELRNQGLIQSFVRTVHHVDDFRSPSLIDCQRKSIIEPDYLIVVSDLWKRQLLVEFGAAATLIHNGVEIERFGAARNAAGNNSAFRSSLGLEDCDLMLSVGGVEPRKNTLTGLRAFVRARETLAREGRRLVWFIAGGVTLFDYIDYREAFFAECRKIDAGEELRLLGPVSDEELGALYREADLLLFPSVKEGWGLVVLEAMAMGLPVIASKVSPLTEYLTHEENALLVEAMDHKGFASQIVRLLSEPEVAGDLKEAGKKTASEFTWRRTAQEHVAFYERVLDGAHDAFGAAACRKAAL